MPEDPRGPTTSTTGLRPLQSDSQQMLTLPLMSYTAITSDREMAGAFVRLLVAAAGKMVPNRQWSATDVRDVIAFALEGGVDPVPLLEGRYLRKRLKEQIARAERYQEPFSLMVVSLPDSADQSHTQALVDLLLERLRRSDMVFVYRRRVAIILPHTPEKAAEGLVARIGALAGATLGVEMPIEFIARTYPHQSFRGPSEVLDWAEDALR
ncbi:MAG: hypothetical protein QME96_08700 [Myxococcota bacterium]|nr:hypothetical protein [Myxococcota bacterium]